MSSPFLSSLFNHDCIPTDGSKSIIKVADVATVIKLIGDIDETDYSAEVPGVFGPKAAGVGAAF